MFAKPFNIAEAIVRKHSEDGQAVGSSRWDVQLADKNVQCREQLLLGDLVVDAQSCTEQYDLLSSAEQEFSM